MKVYVIGGQPYQTLLVILFTVDSFSVSCSISVISVDGWHELFQPHSYRCDIDQLIEDPNIMRPLLRSMFQVAQGPMDLTSNQQ
jgi:hypothetical protein